MTREAVPVVRGGAGRIGVYVSGRQIGSRERLFLAVANSLAGRGWQVDLLAAGPEPALRSAVTAPLGLVDLSPGPLQRLNSRDRHSGREGRRGLVHAQVVSGRPNRSFLPRS